MYKFEIFTIWSNSLAMQYILLNDATGKLR